MSRPRQWRQSVQDDEDDYSESQSQVGSSERPSGETSSSGVMRRENASVGPPPSYDGDRRPGAWEDYKLRAKLWLRTTTIAETSRGPTVDGRNPAPLSKAYT